MKVIQVTGNMLKMAKLMNLMGIMMKQTKKKEREKEREKTESEEKKRQKEIKEKLKEKQDEIDKMKSIIEKFQSKKCSFTEAFTSVKQMLGEFSENLTLPDDDNSEQKAIKRMEDELGKCVDFLQKKELFPAEVIENSTAVQGTFCTKNLSDWIEPRRQVVNIGRNVKFRSSTLTQRDNIVEHDSQSTANTFDKAVEKSGWGFAAELRAFYPKHGGGIEYEGESQEENTSQNHSSLHTSYFCKTTCSVVPVALWAASLSDVSLCKDLIEDLKQIEDIIPIQENLAKEKVKCIFQKYGSHFYCGNVHFGGLFQVKSEFQTEKVSTKSSIKDIVSTMHSASVNACLNVFGIVQIGGGVSGYTQSSEGNIEENKASSELSKIHTSLTKLGGPIEINSLSLWKKGLVQNNNSWVVVDGGKPVITENQLNPKNFVGLWNLVQNESSLFKDSILLSNILIDIWHDVSGLRVPESILKIERIRWHKSKIRKFIERSTYEELSSVSCVHIFKELSTIVQECRTVTGQHLLWKEELKTNGKLHSLLESVLSIQFEDIDRIETGHQVQKLLELENDVNFPKKEAIQVWLKETENPNTAKLFPSDDINSIDAFFKELKAVGCLQSKTLNNKSALASLTGEVANVIKHLFQKFITEKAFIEYMVFVSFVILLDFNVQKTQFRVQLNSTKLSMCIQKTDKIKVDLMKYKKMQTIDTAVQARLFENIILSIISVSGNVEHSDRQKEGENILVMMRFQETVEDILEHFRCSIAPNIQSVITQKDVNAVLDTLTEMANGKEPVVRSHLSWKYFERFSFDNYCTSAVLQDVKMLKKQDVDRNMVDILQTFGLETYFPERISLQKALSIDDHASADPNVKHIPWMILKNLISANSDFREKVLRDFWNPVKVKTSHDDLLEEFFSSDEDDALQTQTYHPSDVFLAIFLCCDPFLKRLIVTKLSVCQFAVPILFGDFQNNDLVFSTWPINDIVLHGETETMITKKRHSVSFIRIGKGSVASKSKLINEFLRELNEHPTFIHKDCMLGKKNRRNVSNGMVEMTWLIPDQTVPMDSSEVNIREPLNIYNLRGDAQQFDRQLNILLLLSNLMVIVISYDDLQQGQFKSILKKVHSSNNSVILLTSMTSKSEDKIFMTQYIAEMNVNKSKTRIISTLEKKRDEIAMLSSTDLKEKLTNNIAKLLSKNVDGIQIQTVRKNLPEGIRSDESKKCAIGRGLSESLLESCKQDGNPDNRKDTFLPLQGKHLWHEISKKEKELKRSKSNVFDKEETILRSIRQLRRNQTDICNKVPRAFSLFVETIVKYMEDEEVLQYFILWFKHMLNNQSRVLSKDLLQKFFHAFKKHESNKDNQEEECKSKAELDKAEDLLADASFGIEHFFREVGQVYEAFMHTKEDFHCEVAFGTLQILKKLPVVVAKLLHLGHSFEIMDGDAANVPQKWVTAVLKEVQSIVGTKRKIVTVSVLGIQSSGKSTLLNTMFGLEFAVSAGRCTRGIYTQLVPVKNIGSIDAEYLLVLDTEGLRAPERAGEKVHHDNEIATLVVGLADVVLLNLKGESIADMANILEIVITGLIRLKQVNKNLILRQSCIFIHQNVSKDAQLQLLQGNRNIVKNLDAMTRDVAIQENIANINNFADVIKFNPTKDIKYIPELFHGSPGMGPINQKYSLEVTDVQKCIVREIAQGIRSVTFENYLLHMKSLWQGIQAEDFIFSFRSILEVKSYGILESEYQRLNWELEELKLEWMNNNIKPRFQSFADSASIANCAQALISECKEVIEIKFEESDKVLQDFVKNSELQEHMEHYIFEKRFSMKAKKEQIEHDILQSIKLEKETCTYKLSSDDILTLKEKQITNTARELAKEFSGNKPTNDEMENEFQKMWTQFLNELASEIPQKTQKEKNAIMKEEIKHILFDLYPKHHGLLKTDLMSYAIDQHLSWPCLSEELLHFEVEPDHVSGKVSIKNVLTLFQTNYKPQARRILGDLSFEIENELDNLRRKENEFNRSQFSTIMKIIVTKFKEVNSRSSEYDFKLTPNLEIPVTLRVARHSFHQFQCMNRNYERKYGLQSRLEIKKPMVHQLFLDTCDKQAEEIIATNSLCNVLKISIEEKLQRELNLKMQREIMQRFNLRKHHLMKEVMEDLAKIGNFDIFMKYINSPETYVQKWLRKRTDEYIFQQNNNSGYSSYTSWLEITIPDIIDKIKDTVRLTTKQSHSKMRSWMQCFQQDIINNLALVLNNASFGLLSDHEIKNFDNFVLSIYKKLSELDTELLKTWKEKNPSDFTWGKENPYDCIFSFLWGCLSKCPWCKEPCQRADANHESGNTVHTCLQHRPAGIGGTSFKPTGEMSIESCNFDVQSTLQRSCGKWCGCPKEECEVYHPYSTYKTYMKDWDIEPLGDMSNSKYWNWFMAKFSEQLANYFKKKQSKIPASWKSLTVEEAVQSLSEIYV